MTEPMPSAKSPSESEIRQSARDREYAAACKAAGIEPDLPKYERFNGIGDAKVLEAIIHGKHSVLDGIDEGDDFQFFDDEPEPDGPDKLPAEALTVLLKFLDVLLPNESGVNESVRVSGIRALVLSWMLERGELAKRSMASMALELGITKACLSWHARQIEKATGLHARGQKSTSSIAVYKQAREAAVANGMANLHAIGLENAA